MCLSLPLVIMKDMVISIIFFKYTLYFIRDNFRLTHIIDSP